MSTEPGMKAEDKITERIVEIMSAVDKQCEEIAGEQMGILMLIFPLARPGTCNRVQNTSVAETIQVLEQTLDYLRANPGDSRPLAWQ